LLAKIISQPDRAESLPTLMVEIVQDLSKDDQL
jgi:hypothetical protein